MQALDDPRRLFGTDALQDPYPRYAQLRAQAQVHRIGDSQFYAVCGWDAVVEAVSRVEDFSSNLTATMVFGDDGSVTAFPMGNSMPRSMRWPPPTIPCMRRNARSCCRTCRRNASR